MPLTVHHLEKSQSERVIWLVEELQIPYELVLHKRNPETALSPQSIKDLHPAGTAPVMVDDSSPTNGEKVVLAESGAILEYIIQVHGGGRLALTAKDKNFAQYVNWLHFANATLQATLGRVSTMKRTGVSDDHPYAQFVIKKWHNVLGMLDQRVKETGQYLAGEEFTAADIMTVFTLTTMRGFFPYDLSGYKGILDYLQRIGQRDGYKRAMEKGDPGLTPILGPTVEAPFVFGKK